MLVRIKFGSSNLVLDYSLKIVEQNQIEKNIDAVLSKVSSNVDFLNSIKLLYMKAIYWHDIGKINENFQLEKMNNHSFDTVEYGISSKHSILSAYLYLVSCFNHINKSYHDSEDKKKLIAISICLALPIWRHHTGIEKSLVAFITDQNEGLPICEKLNIYLDKLNLSIDKQIHRVIIDYLVNGDLKNKLVYYENYFSFKISLLTAYYIGLLCYSSIYELWKL